MKKLILLLTVIVAIFSFALTTHANTYNFFPITYNSLEPIEVGNSINMDVSESSSLVNFTFTNQFLWEGDPNTPSVITQIYFYDKENLLIYSSLEEGSGVNFSIGSGNVPGWETVDYLTGYSDGADFSFDADPPPTSNGINYWDGVGDGDYLTIIFNGNYNNVITALNSGDLVIGLHVQSLPLNDVDDPFGASDGFTTVPIPATVWIFGAGLIGLVGVRRKLRAS